MTEPIGSDRLLGWRRRPDLMVRELFGATPDAWQDGVLIDFAHFARIAMACCKGPGKTTVEAWCAWNFLLTRTRCRGAAVSITGDNLDANLWAELGKWHAVSPVLQSQFEITASAIRHYEHGDRWSLQRRTWSKTANDEELGQTLAGLWAAPDPDKPDMRTGVLFLIDEAGGVPVPILRTAEAALQREGTEGKIVMGGNTTQNDGCLYYAVILHRADWRVFEVTGDPDDPKRSPRISLEYARREIATHGRDNPWVMINILAKFPKQGINQLLGPDQVREALGRHVVQNAYDWAPRILGMDVADQGDDRTVIAPRQGLAYLPPIVLRLMDPVQIAGFAMGKANTWQAHSIQVDATGGYGTGPIAIMRDQGFSVMPIQFASEPINPKFFNKRAEIWWLLAEHIKSGASLPTQDQQGAPLGDLVAELTVPTYGYKGDKIIIEPKDAIKARLGRSPDIAEAMACTHAYPVAVPERTAQALQPFGLQGNVTHAKTDYDPLERG